MCDLSVEGDTTSINLSLLLITQPLQSGVEADLLQCTFVLAWEIPKFTYKLLAFFLIIRGI